MAMHARLGTSTGDEDRDLVIGGEDRDLGSGVHMPREQVSFTKRWSRMLGEIRRHLLVCGWSRDKVKESIIMWMGAGLT